MININEYVHLISSLHSFSHISDIFVFRYLGPSPPRTQGHADRSPLARPLDEEMVPEEAPFPRVANIHRLV